jgi:ABC-type transport system involved in cytochrome bd biosynthesis fused ATPase/permease subunit
VVKDVTWKHVAIVLGFFATVAVLSLTGQDTATFIVVGMAILAGVGLVAVQATGAKEQTAAVKEQTNGNTTRLLDIVEAQGKLLAQMQPAQSSDDQEAKP